MISDGLTPNNSIFEDPQVESTPVLAAAGQVIYEPDTPARQIFYIQRGEVRLYIVSPGSACRLVAILGPGGWFGAGALAGDSAHGCRATAVTSSELLAADVGRFLDVLSRRPEALLALNKDLAARLMAAAYQASSLIFEDSNQRLINTLVRFSRSVACTKRGDDVVLRITHDQLAQAIGVARETVSLALTQLRHRNVLRTGRNQLMFNPEVLRQLSGESLLRELRTEEWATA